MNFLKWAGGKRKLLPIIKQLLPKQFDAYYEPFVGGGAVYFGLIGRMGIPSYLSDINEELVNAYRCVRDIPQAVDELLKAWPNNRATYYQIRDGEYSLPATRAARFIYINKVGFNGLWRVNRSGKCNTSYGGEERGTNYLPAIFDISQALAGVSLLCQSYQEVAIDNDHAFVYCDPPYTDTDTMYIDHSFDQIQFAQWVKSLPCLVMVSHFDNEYIRALYAGLNFHEVSVRHVISGLPSGRHYRKELLITNYAVR